MLFTQSVLLGSLATLALALPTPQSADTIPACANLCISAKIAEAPTLAYECDGVDVACYCSTPAFVNAFATCLSQHCDSADLATASAFGQMFCADAGVGIGGGSVSANPSSSAFASAIAASYVAQASASVAAISQSAAAAVMSVSSVEGAALASVSAEYAAGEASLSAAEASVSAAYSGASYSDAIGRLSASGDALSQSAAGAAETIRASYSQVVGAVPTRM